MTPELLALAAEKIAASGYFPEVATKRCESQFTGRLVWLVRTAPDVWTGMDDAALVDWCKKRGWKGE